jgi:hypothetical protein
MPNSARHDHTAKLYNALPGLIPTARDLSALPPSLADNGDGPLPKAIAAHRSVIGA